MILVSPAEPKVFKALGASSPAPERFGADFLIPSTVGFIAVQRKEFPSDFMSSLRDGRLARLSADMQDAPVRILVLEGQPRWSKTGELMGAYGRPISRGGLTRLLLSMGARGIDTYWTRSMDETVEFLHDVEAWAEKEAHETLSTRPGSPRNAFGRTTERDRQLWALQGIADGLGVKTAEAIIDHFGRLPLSWDCTEAELLEVPGVGPKRLSGLTSMIPTKPAT